MRPVFSYADGEGEMSQQTRLTPAELRATAGRHDSEADSLNRERQRVQGEVSALVSGNSGALINTLKRVHEQWDGEFARIEQKLREMAEQVRNSANKLESTDETSGQDLMNVGNQGNPYAGML
ncbi:WXG100 family type VII secretion target [Actinoalloteichus caeruleus]|uniref:WXG100 family type VII secretion target n=2 Tax=Pseudonocardiaceae TaxID=2070 RepID=A0ABT1JDX7_ACTCY|nr:WXG100 family type VII secretion target [Actinoalloteichus caeruleus]MCP2330697.1 WXG100 family type VII secretion target [Actinoalloteichus caeruleus DSM 43889]